MDADVLIYKVLSDVTKTLHREDAKSAKNLKKLGALRAFAVHYPPKPEESSTSVGRCELVKGWMS